jgi:chromatin segregation and condensation protein Rec8/ScpA/Scc1 (kleisin family)
MDKVFTFRPLLHLATGREIDLDQKAHFGEIGIKLANVPDHLKPEPPKEEKAKD